MLTRGVEGTPRRLVRSTVRRGLTSPVQGLRRPEPPQHPVPETDQVPWRLDFTGEHDGLYRAQRIAGCELFASERWCPDLSR